MLKLTNIKINGNAAEMLVLIEGDTDKAYSLKLGMSGECYSVISSDIPSEYKMYERQAKAALRKYHGKQLPDEITSMWY